MSYNASGSAPEPPWPDSLDAMVAAPEHHQLLFENERVRVLTTRIPPGDTVPVHTHRWPSVQYTFSWSDFIRYDPEGKVLLDTRTVPSGPGLSPVRWSASDAAAFSEECRGQGDVQHSRRVEGAAS